MSFEQSIRVYQNSPKTIAQWVLIEAAGFSLSLEKRNLCPVEGFGQALLFRRGTPGSLVEAESSELIELRGEA